MYELIGFIHNNSHHKNIYPKHLFIYKNTDHKNISIFYFSILILPPAPDKCLGKLFRDCSVSVRICEHLNIRK